MDINKTKKLYEIAPMLSPSIYETIFHNQYQGRSDKNSIILDDSIFDKYYVEENVYRSFLFSHSNKLNNSINYIGLNQMHNSIIKEVEKKDNNITITLFDTGLLNLYNTLIEFKSIENVKLDSLSIKILFEGIECFSNNLLEKDEVLIETSEDIIDRVYIQDQITYIGEDGVTLVVSTQKDRQKLYYLLIKCKNIKIIDETKKKWMEVFNPHNFAMLYDYFINIRKSSRLILEKSVFINIIEDYEKFMEDLDFI